MEIERSLRIREAGEPSELALVRQLFIEYSQLLGIDLCFQNFENELRTLPGGYAPPDGTILLAHEGDEVVGCVALRPLGHGVGEMKRLYVKDQFRAKGYGRELTLAVIDAARRIGHRRLRLDTLPSMGAAIALYRSLGFVEIAPYYPNPVDGALFLELPLDGSSLTRSVRD